MSALLAVFMATLLSAKVNGVQLHYVDRGSGAPVIFVHGGLTDYREWLPVADLLGTGYRTIAYSRRYNFPNHNALRKNHSAEVEVADLAALIRHLKIAPANVVGVSYGGYTALLLALEHPELVRSLVVADPALLPWLADIPGGAPELNDFMMRMWTPAGAAFKAGDNEKALQITIDYFAGGPVPAEVRAMLKGNLREWEALTTSPHAFAPLSRERVRALRVPVLILKGEKTMKMFQLIDPELARVLEGEEEVTITGGTHDMCTEYPDRCAAAIGQFLARH